MTARLILICHAPTVAMRRAAFRIDEPLDDKGRGGAANLAGYLPSADRWLTSPELRTRQTADALQLDADVQPQLRLRLWPLEGQHLR
jgi:broad specificity phosphatase PhoE